MVNVEALLVAEFVENSVAGLERPYARFGARCHFPVTPEGTLRAILRQADIDPDSFLRS